MVLAAVGDGPLEKVLASELTKEHKVALRLMYPLDDFHRDGFVVENMQWEIVYEGIPNYLENQKDWDWDWVLALARVIGFLNTDGWISENQAQSEGSSNYYRSTAYIGTLYDVCRFKEDLFTVCGEWGGFREHKSSNSLIYRISLPVSLATAIAQMDGQTTGRRMAKSVMAAYSAQHGFSIGRGSSIPHIPVRFSNFAPFTTVDTNTDDTEPRYFNWNTVFVQSAMFEYAGAMREKLQEMVEMFARCGITGLSVKGEAGDARVFGGDKEISSQFWIHQDKPLPSLTVDISRFGQKHSVHMALIGKQPAPNSRRLPRSHIVV
ncbi:hypothetical protein GGH94_005144 [Coemansia aciculifera]|uniref:Uncharacterized protein n=1 Tax=Coemansia aciculifera TaxID=417176 RepID=A0A9W8M3F1_9FUNG|nr:hypothetical protein GGH94_005144 [Coemansia aciculifera]